MTLVYKQSQKPVKVGDRVTDSRGDLVTVLSFREPRTPESSGKVMLRLPGGFEHEYYVTVIGAEWIGRTDRLP